MGIMGSSCTRADAEGVSASIMRFAGQKWRGLSGGRDARTLVTATLLFAADDGNTVGRAVDGGRAFEGEIAVSIHGENGEVRDRPGAIDHGHVSCPVSNVGWTAIQRCGHYYLLNDLRSIGR